MTLQERTKRWYDRTMVGSNIRRYYEDSGFFNFGYWHAQAKSPREASEALIDQLLGKIPHRGGRILDVACGLGASTRRLMSSYAPDMITGVNFSEAQIAEARKRAPGCKLLYMDAARLDFSDAQFDAVICVEAAYHFNTRDAFLREALRVLRPGGSLVLSDILVRDFIAVLAFLPFTAPVPRANLVSDITSYITRLEAAGFDEIDVQDATEACLGGYYRHLVRWAASERTSGRMGFAKSVVTSLACQILAGYCRSIFKTYLLVSARKPVIQQN